MQRLAQCSSSGGGGPITPAPGRHSSTAQQTLPQQQQPVTTDETLNNPPTCSVISGSFRRDTRCSSALPSAPTRHCSGETGGQGTGISEFKRGVSDIYSKPGKPGAAVALGCISSSRALTTMTPPGGSVRAEPRCSPVDSRSVYTVSLRSCGAGPRIRAFCGDARSREVWWSAMGEKERPAAGQVPTSSNQCQVGGAHAP